MRLTGVNDANGNWMLHADGASERDIAAASDWERGSLVAKLEEAFGFAPGFGKRGAGQE